MLQFAQRDPTNHTESMLNIGADYKNPFSDDPAHSGLALPPIKRSSTILNSEGHQWELVVTGIARRGLSLKLNDAYFCDGADQLTHPIKYRLHMHPGASYGRDVSIDEKMNRMVGWQDAIKTFDRLMDSEIRYHSMDSLISLIENGHIARGEVVELDTANPSLRMLFTTLGFQESSVAPHPFLASWSELAALAKSGQLVDTWLKQKELK